MKRILYILSVMLLVMLTTACEDYLDKSPDSESFTKEEVFSDYTMAQQFVDQLLIPSYWDCDPWDDRAWASEKETATGLPLQMNGSRDRITDDCTPAHLKLTSDKMYNIRRGDFIAAQNDRDFRWMPNQWRRWDVKWKAIRIANLSITNIDQLIDATEEEKANILGLAYFMKGHFYFQVVQNWGGMPWLDGPMDPSGDMDLPRDDYATTMQNIAESFDMAAKYLPTIVASAEWGRPSRVAALTYKAKALLFAASPFANPTNNQKMWEDAAIAAGEALAAAKSSGYYQLIEKDKWRNLFHGCVEETFQEILFGIFHKDKQWKKGQPDWWYSGIRSKAFGSGAAAESVTENLAQCFTWSNGDPIDPTTAEYKTTPYTGDGINHTGRDPRFDMSIVYNGQANPMTTRLGRNVQIWNESYDNKAAEELKLDAQGSSQKGYTITGYYNWKLKADANFKNNAKTSHMFNFIRLADLYLFYAEAANRAYGPTTPAPGFSMSAVEVLNELRARVDMPAYDNSTPGLTIGSIDEFEQKIRNEYRVETAFEDKRFYNLRRWRILDKAETLEQMGMYIKKTGADEFEYSIVRIDETYQLYYQEQHYLFPIENSDTFLGPDFVQNPGW
ncbi:RagB/SusD family nutrient uptake outer membrane protein [Saccharicrinis sp. 156]|uniref:RagB/SusD family nutrient uptake outer membrane protein n=1 Tax=Saccharicrinis sp. 156 TaxID=3417574 RepID=UPI003D33A7D9